MVNGILKENINLLIVIILFIVLCVSYILVIPVFEAPDEPGHFLYAFYISKYNKIPSPYNELISTEQYIKENIDEKVDKYFYMDSKYMFYKEPFAGYEYYRDQRHHPATYYLISSQIIKPFNVNNIYIEDNLNQEYGIYNKFADNKILKNNSSTISLVLILRLFQIVYGVLIIFFIFKIIKLLSDDEFKNNSIILLAGIAFLPQFVFLCSYINNDVLAALFGLISAYFTVLLFKRDKFYLGLISVLFAFIGGFTKYTILIMVPVVVAAFLIWLVIKKKKIWAILGISVIVILSIIAFYYIINFGKASYEKTKIEAGWEENNNDENIEAGNDASVSNYALSFDGKSNKVSILTTPSSAVTELTIESWVYVRSFNNDSNVRSTAIVSNWNIWSPDNQKGYLLRAFYYDSTSNSLQWQFIVCDGVNYQQVVFENIPYNDFVTKYANKWLHISGVFKGGDYMKLLINGEVKETLDTGIPEKMEPNIGTPTYLYYTPMSPGYTDGIIDEVRIWNVARTQEQIQSCMSQELTGNEEGLAGYWNFNKGRGSTVYDNTINKNHGTIHKITKYSSPLLNKILKVSSGLLADLKYSKRSLINMPALTVTFKSTVAFFGWMNIAADKFIYNYFLAYIISGILLFFANIRDYKKSIKSIIFIMLSTISIFVYFLVYAASTNWAQKQGRVILLAVFLTYILAILGFKSVKAEYRNILYYGLFASSLFISVFCLYNYIYLAYY